MRTNAEYKQYTESQVNGFLTFLYVLLAMIGIISLVGIINTLALSVFERTREIGMLRAVGTTRRQLRRMVRYEIVITVGDRRRDRRRRRPGVRLDPDQGPERPGHRSSRCRSRSSSWC